LGFGHEDWHAGEDALESAGQGFYADVGARIFPEQDVVFEIDRTAGKLDAEDGNEFAVEMVSDASEGFGLGAAGFQDGGRWAWGTPQLDF
jgi:hypothetical protein